MDQAEPIRHQVFEVPKVAATVNEYWRFAGRCAGCAKAHRAALPAGVPSGQIGPRALALLGALGTHYHLTQHKMSSPGCCFGSATEPSYGFTECLRDESTSDQADEPAALRPVVLAMRSAKHFLPSSALPP